MRLSEEERKIIKETLAGLDREAEIYLFGSRADDSKKGGDIDLLILSRKLGQQAAATLKLRLFERMEEQRIDIVIAEDTRAPFVRLALQGAVLL